MPRTAGEPTTLARVWSSVGTVVAPATLVSALLFYFGYVSARSFHLYFGVDVDTLELSTQEFVMRATQPLLVPALVLLLAAAGLTWADGVVRGRLEVLPPDRRRGAVRRVAGAGSVLLAVAVGLLLAFPAVGGWAAYPLVTPLLLASGAALLAFASRWADHPAGRRATVVLLALVVVTSVLWATATLAQWSGTGRAKALARDLTSLPAVVVDLPEPLFPGDDAVVETAFPAAGATEGTGGAGDAGTYRYRYRGLRLLAEGGGRLFLVPERWSPSGSTFVVHLDEARVRFRFVDDPP